MDVGCGKGRPLIIASTYPFKRIEGVEISKNLCRIAEKNVKKIPKSEQRCSQLSIYCTDIISYELPSDNLILFCYNPISGIILDHFLSNINKSLDEISRHIYLIFINRFNIHESLDKTSFLKRVQEVDLGEKYKKEMWHSYVYKNVL